MNAKIVRKVWPWLLALAVLTPVVWRAGQVGVRHLRARAAAITVLNMDIVLRMFVGEQTPPCLLPFDMRQLAEVELAEAPTWDYDPDQPMAPAEFAECHDNRFIYLGGGRDIRYLPPTQPLLVLECPGRPPVYAVSYVDGSWRAYLHLPDHVTNAIQVCERQMRDLEAPAPVVLAPAALAEAHIRLHGFDRTIGNKGAVNVLRFSHATVPTGPARACFDDIVQLMAAAPPDGEIPADRQFGTCTMIRGDIVKTVTFTGGRDSRLKLRYKCYRLLRLRGVLRFHQ